MMLADHLAKTVIGDEYFGEVMADLEKATAEKFFQIAGNPGISDVGRRDLLRFADILSHSSTPNCRDTAYRIVALLTEINGLDQELSIYASAVLSKLGNFPGLAFLRKHHDEQIVLPVERELEKISKERVQRTADGTHIFTDSQYRIRTELAKHDYFSFSGPTSVGKSFIIKDYIRVLASSPELDHAAIVVLVPTRALITQLATELRQEIDDPNVNIATFPASSPYLRSRFRSTVYVFTPERLLSFLSRDSSRIKCLFVDEAQKVTSVNDERSSLYYHAIYETTRRFATKLIFASPNIPNPGIFLDIFERDQNRTIAVTERTVSQNKYFIDLVHNQASYFVSPPGAGSSEEVPLNGLGVFGSVYDIVLKLGGNVSNLIYCNAASATVTQALGLAAALPDMHISPELQELLDFVSEFVHVDYYLIQCLRKGVAFHHGRMPQQVRSRVESLFTMPHSPLRFIFCTSTLLEGVNLPAKNIFVLTELHGRSAFSRIDFENLIGRAGRLTREFSGNVVCIRAEPNRWQRKELLTSFAPVPVTSFLTDSNRRRKSEFANIGKALAGTDMASGLTLPARANFSHYAAMLLSHQLDMENSPLKAKFLEKITDAQQVLRTAAAANSVPSYIIRISPTIRPTYQNNVLRYVHENQAASQHVALDGSFDLLPLLEKLYDLYQWGVEETHGSSPLIPAALVASGYGKSRLKYWAMLMDHWIKAEPLNRLIVFSIFFHERQGYIWFRENGRPKREDFVRDARHINIVIEQLMNDIENGLRYKIVRYLQNYYDISRHVLGPESNVVNLAELVEYGTLDPRCKSLQNLGFTRTGAEYLLANHHDLFVFDRNDELLGVSSDRLLAEVGTDQDVFQEILELIR